MEIATKISFETESHEIFILRLGDSTGIRGWCDLCDAEVDLLTIDQSVSRSGVATLALVHAIDAGEIHAKEAASGHLMICGESLNNAKENLYVSK